MHLAPEICERARLSRDRRFDGQFFVGVRTTRIYCRPICPARAPKRANVTFFPSAAAAAEGGYRPCLRCRPEAAPGSPAWRGTASTVARALRMIEGGALDEGDVASLAARLGVGERHLRRLFVEHLGAAPLAVARTRRVHVAKSLLDQTDLPMADVAMAAGFGSVRQFNTTMRRVYGQPPSSLRQGRRARRAAGATGAARGAGAARTAGAATATATATGATVVVGATGEVGTSGAVGTTGAAAPDRGKFTLRLPYRPPYDWDGMLRFFAHRAIPGVEAVTADGYRRTFAVDGASGTLSVVAAADGTALIARVQTSSTRVLPRVVDRLRRQFDLHLDPDEVAAHLSRDPRLAAAYPEARGIRLPGAFDGFEVAVRGILGQQVTVKGATTISGRVVERCGTAIHPGAAVHGAAIHHGATGDGATGDGATGDGATGDGATGDGATGDGATVHGATGDGGTAGLTHRFPTAERLATADLAAIGMPGARAGAVRALACAVRDGDIVLDDTADVAETCRRLQELPGIGPWTATYVAMRVLGDPDAFPEGDLGLRKALVPGELVAPRELRERAERWRPWRGYAAAILWRSLNQTSGG